MLGPTITFHGRGYGHGVGMSQHGARGRALAGQSAAEILAHYYQGTSQGSIALDTPIRVRVLDDFAATPTNPLVVVGRRSAWSIDGVAATFPRDARIEVRGTASKATSGPAYVWRARVVTAGGSIVYDARITTFRMRGADASTVLQVASRTSDHDTYRGALRVGLNGSTGRASVTNELAIEHYLRGVVPAEMPASWPQAALEAQSIAARSFAARRLRPGTSYFDVVDDTSGDVPLGRRRRDRAQRERLRVCGGRARRDAGQLPARVARPSARRVGVRRRVAVRDLADRHVQPIAALGVVRGGRADERRGVDGARPAGTGRVGSAHPRDADRLPWDEDRVGRRLPRDLQRPPTGRRPDAAQHALRYAIDPVTRDHVVTG
jgi:hypothetical protein